MSTAERLLDYYDFDETVVQAVSEAAERQNQKSFMELADEYGLSDGAEPLAQFKTQRERPFFDSIRWLEYIDLVPKHDYDEARARLLFTPMGIPVDESIAMRAIRMFEADPSERLMVVGSPARLGNNANILRLGDMYPVSRGDLRHAVGPALRQLQHDDVYSLTTLGYSYGAETAATAAAEASKFGIAACRGVWVEPPAVVNRSVRQLLSQFRHAGHRLDEYVTAPQSRPLIEARELADKGFMRYAGGMGRLSNMAIATTLSKDTFEPRVRSALKAQQELDVTIAWGTASEITPHERMVRMVEDLQGEFPLRVGALAVEGMHHAGGDDIDLHAAIMLQGMR